MIRFTPRRVGSVWSAKNVATIERLIAEGRMAPLGIAAWEARDPDKTNRYSFEEDGAALSDEQEALFRAFWEDQPPGYRRQATWWVVSAKREEARKRRLDRLMEDAAAGLRIKELRR